jgi:lysophospholipase L1-like esterase
MSFSGCLSRPPGIAVRVGASLALSVVAIAALALPAAGAGKDDPTQRWIGIWSASPLRPDPIGITDQAVVSRSGFEDQTLREIVYPHFGGTVVRVRLANTFSDAPLTIGQAQIAVQAEGAAIVSGSARPLTFSGQASPAIPPGAELYSDPVTLNVDALRSVAISLYLPGPTGPITWHSTGRQTLYIAPGNQLVDGGGSQFEARTTVPSWYVIDGVEVVATSPDQAAIVTFGDSITDGTASTQDANNRWPDYLARRLAARPGNQLSVIDEGIAGNRVLSDTPTYVNALARLERDVLAQSGVKYVTLLEGINDIGQTCLGNANASAEDLLVGYRQIITQVHRQGLKIFGATLTPFKGAAYYCEDGETKRGILNTFIRTSGEFDGVIDFDLATHDPANPLVFLSEFDSGDHLHPNDAGYQAMANAIDLGQFSSTR